MARLAGLAEGETADRQAPLWVELGRALVRLDRIGEAVQAYAQAVGCRAGPQAETELAVLFALRGEPARAAAALDAVLARHPDHAEARIRLATLLLEEGRHQAVLELLGPPPPAGAAGAQWRAQKSFALLLDGQVPAARAVLPRMRSGGRSDILVVTQHMRLALGEGDTQAVTALAAELAALADDPGRARLADRVEAHFQLGGLHAAAAPDRAMRHWSAGHRLLSAAQPFSRAGHHALLRATAAAFGRDRFEGGPTSGEHDPAPVFIVGHPRTGTTLAEHILAAHPAVHGAGERLALLQAVQRLAGNTLDPATPGRAAGLDGRSLAVEALAYLDALKAEAPPGTARIVDKMPANAMQLGFAATLLPGARIICCARDRVATGFSIFRRRLSGHHPYAHDLGDLAWWMRAQEGLMAHWRQVLPVPMLTVRLDDWATDFRGTLARVLTFLDLPYDSACEAFHLQDRAVRTASRDQVRRPVAAAGDAWRPYAGQLAALLDGGTGP